MDFNVMRHEIERLVNGGGMTPYESESTLSQSLKQEMKCTRLWSKKPEFEREALETIAGLISRVIHSKNIYANAMLWADMGHYCELVQNALNHHTKANENDSGA